MDTFKKGKVLITGATGCIGSSLLNRCLNIGLDINILIRSTNKVKEKYINHKNINIFVGDINEKNVLEKACYGCEIIYHLASAVHHYEDKPFQEYEYFQKINVEGTLNLLNANINNKSLKKFVFFSTAGLDNSVIDTSYLKSKSNAEKLCLEYFAKYNMPIVILRPALVFGENDRGNFYKMIDAIFKNRFFIIGDGNNKKSIIYVENLIDYTISIANSDKSAGKIYGIADKNAYTLNYMVDLISKHLEVKKPYHLPRNILFFIISIWESSFGRISFFKKGNLKYVRKSIINKLTESNITDTSLLYKEYADISQIPFEEAIIKTIKWYKNI
ncbi:MAG: NAD(P)-dependent oxidoreductase [Deltaproteobacteria bacterium]|nr:NAD(P)-dependent oxidoreductase [Deltaproteobacteria bacterium]